MEHSNLAVTLARDADLIEVANLVNSAYRGDSSRVGWTTEADWLDGLRTSPEILRQELQTNSAQSILLLRDLNTRRLVACVSLLQVKEDSGATFYLGMLTVDPREQDRGLGRRMLAEAERFAVQKGANSIVLGVIQLRHELIAWYERRGYRRTGATKAFPYQDRNFGVPKREDLHFVMFAKTLNI